MGINHDFHIHTNLSLCAAETVTAEHYINKAKELGLNKIGFTNHMWDENIQPFLNRSYKIQTVPYNLELRDELKTLDKQGIKVYFGAEAEFHPIYGVALTEENAEKFDYIIVPNSHTHMTMDKSLYKPYEKHAEFMVEAYEKIIGSAVSRHIWLWRIRLTRFAARMTGRSYIRLFPTIHISAFSLQPQKRE